MSEPENPQETTPQEEASPAPEPTQDTEPEKVPAPDSAGSESSNRSVMIVLSYLWILALIPLLVEKDDAEVQWHAKHGLVLTGAEIILQVIFNAITATGVGCVFAVFIPIVFLAFAIIRLVCIVKGLGGERFMIPGISQYADKF